jgi:hypothetical protein
MLAEHTTTLRHIFVLTLELRAMDTGGQEVSNGTRKKELISCASLKAVCRVC